MTGSGVEPLPTLADLLSELFKSIHPPKTLERNLPPESFKGLVDPSAAAAVSDSSGFVHLKPNCRYSHSRPTVRSRRESSESVTLCRMWRPCSVLMNCRYAFVLQTDTVLPWLMLDVLPGSSRVLPQPARSRLLQLVQPRRHLDVGEPQQLPQVSTSPTRDARRLRRLSADDDLWRAIDSPDLRVSRVQRPSGTSRWGAQHHPRRECFKLLGLK